MKKEQDEIYNRFDKKRDVNVNSIAYRANKVIQSAEMNELQSITHNKSTKLTDRIFQQADVVSGGQSYLSRNGKLILDKGEVYLNGNIYKLSQAEIIVDLAVTETEVGVWLVTSMLTEDDDATLRNPAIGTRGEAEEGAWREIIVGEWGLATEDKAGKFYKVYLIKDGYLTAKEPPPQINSVTTAITKYDKDSSGGTYIISGMTTHSVESDKDDEQVFVVDAGRARVAGVAIEFPTSRRFSFKKDADKATVANEPHLAVSINQLIKTNRYPIAKIKAVTITAMRTVEIIHANYDNSEDLLPDASTIEVVSLVQGLTSYEENKDFKLTTSRIDWNLNGEEPATGSSYQVTYKYIKDLTIPAYSLYDLIVVGAVAGTRILITYDYFKKRVDRLCLDSEGEAQIVRGVAANERPLEPHLADDLLLLATIPQNWDEQEFKVRLDGVRLVPMQELQKYGERLDYLTELLAQTRLEQSANMQESGKKRGLFADPFLTDKFRDLGREQNAVVERGNLKLPINAHSDFFNLKQITTLNYKNKKLFGQDKQTECMLINPYKVFTALPCDVTVTPAIDRWTETVKKTTQTDKVFSPQRGTDTELVGVSKRAAQKLRQIYLELEIKSFGAGEKLKKVTFDSVTVIPRGQTVADSDGNLKCKIRIPKNIPAGRKLIELIGEGGTEGVTAFVGNGTIETENYRKIIYVPLPPPPPQRSVNELRSIFSRFAKPNITQITNNNITNVTEVTNVTNVTEVTNVDRRVTNNIVQPRWSPWARVDPLAQTFTLDSTKQISALDLWVCEKGKKRIRIQIRETTAGIPNQNILAQSDLAPSQISTSGPSRWRFDLPVLLQVGIEYAIIVMSDEAEPSVQVAELGGFDESSQKYITAQPYTVGVLLSSSNLSTWTPHNNKDLRFLLLECQFTQADKVVQIGELEAFEITDLCIYYNAEITDVSTNIDIIATMPDQTELLLSEGQIVELTAPATGKIKIEARLVGGNFTPVLFRDIQIITGTIQQEANYITRAIQAGVESRVRVLVDSFLPAGSSLQVRVTPANSNDFQILKLDVERKLDGGRVELSFETEAKIDANDIQIELIITGSASARAKLENLRVMVI